MTTWSAASATVRCSARPSVYSARMPPPIATIEVPATSANLGSGFDCFAAALSLKLRGELHAGDEAGIVLNAHGEGAPGPDDDPEQNLLIRAFREGLRLAHGSFAWALQPTVSRRPENSGSSMPWARLGSSTWFRSDTDDTWSLHWSKSCCPRALVRSESSLLACVPQYLEEYLRNGITWWSGRG